MVAPLQFKWFRIEQDASGAILSCEEVDAKGRKGAHVRYYEALDKASACSAAMGWYAAYTQVKREKSRTRRTKFAELGLCSSCSRPKEPGREDVQVCKMCAARAAERQRATKGRRESPLRPARLGADEFVRRMTGVSEPAKRRALPRQSQQCRHYVAMLEKFDRVTPNHFRTWLVGAITRLGGAKALAEYESSRAESLDKATTAAYKRAAKATRRSA